jgi:hypothetical protein
MRLTDIVTLRTSLRTLGVLAIVSYARLESARAQGTGCGFPKYVDVSCGTVCSCQTGPTQACQPASFCGAGNCIINGACS